MSKSGMTHSFSRIPQANINRSVFAGPSRHITTFNSDKLIPFYREEVLPGDTFHVSASIYARMASLKKPIMESVKMDTFYFYVPNRLLWEHWPAFIGEQADPLDPIEYEVPQYGDHEGNTGFRSLSLEDYFGAAVGVVDETIISLYSRAYYMIWNEWFRDENLCEPMFECKGDSDVDDNDEPVSYGLKSRGKRHDYFTSCLPWAQKGEPVSIPLGGQAPVFGNGYALGLRGEGFNYGLMTINDDAGLRELTASNDAYGKLVGATADTTYIPDAGRTNGVVTKANTSGQYEKSGLIADLSEAVAYDVNTLRTAMQLQIMLEKDARGGTRYTEIMRVHYGVVSPDARLQRPEYLGGSNSTMDVYPISQTSATTSGSPQANLAGQAIITNKSGFSKSFTEFGVVIGIMCVQADLTYQQGTPRDLKRRTKHDYAWPSLAHLGEQAVYNYEIFTQGPDAINPATGVPYDLEVFGYNERYAEYRHRRNLITGDMRSNVTSPESSGSLDIWHLSQDFDGLPRLNETFITSDTPIARVVAVPGTAEAPVPDFIADIYFNLKYVRPLPTFGVPGLMDHF